MIWLVWVFGFFTVLGTSQLARRMGRGDRAVIAILFAGLLATIGYLFIGRAGLADQPYRARIAQLEAIPPEQRSRAEILAQIESLIREQPDNPRPHFIIGEMMAGEGRDDDAIRAFQSALRRDDRFVPAMLGMADAMTRAGGGVVSPQAQRIYERAASLDPTQLHAGFMVGVGQWQDGNDAAAQLAWDGLWVRLDGKAEAQRTLVQRIETVTAGTMGVRPAQVEATPAVTEASPDKPASTDDTSGADETPEVPTE